MPKSLMQPVFLIAVACVLALVIAGAAAPVAFGAWADAGLRWTTKHFGWFYLASVFGFVVVLVYLAVSKYGDIRLGSPDSRPDYSSFSWIAMLLAAGFGVGLVFYGMAEPVTHFLKPPYGVMAGGTPEAARLAIQYSFFNWGIHQWAAFSVVGPSSATTSSAGTSPAWFPSWWCRG